MKNNYLSSIIVSKVVTGKMPKRTGSSFSGSGGIS